MKEIMMQYGQSLIATVIALLIMVIIGGSSAHATKGISVQIGQMLPAQQIQENGTAEFERYWRIR